MLQMPHFEPDAAFSCLSIGILPTGIVALGVYTGAYMAEVVRAGIESIPKGQFEAAQSQGFTYVERMYYIILPQSAWEIHLKKRDQRVTFQKTEGQVTDNE